MLRERKKKLFECIGYSVNMRNCGPIADKTNQKMRTGPASQYITQDGQVNEQKASIKIKRREISLWCTEHIINTG